MLDRYVLVFCIKVCSKNIVGFKNNMINNRIIVSIMLVFERWWIFLFSLVVIEIIVKLIILVIMVIWMFVLEGKLNK